MKHWKSVVKITSVRFISYDEKEVYVLLLLNSQIYLLPSVIILLTELIALIHFKLEL